MSAMVFISPLGAALGLYNDSGPSSAAPATGKTIGVDFHR